MAIFFIVLPFIILHVNGYRLNTKKNILQKTGMMFIESEPEGAEVWLNEKLVDNQTPVRIKNLLPNKYQVRLSKEGYMDWEKEIKVIDGQTNTIQYIRLFKDNSVPQLLVSGDILEVMQSGDENNLILLRKDEGYRISVLDLGNGSEEEAWSGVSEVVDLKLVAGGNKLAVYMEDNMEIVDLANKEIVFSAVKDLEVSRPAKLRVDEYNGNFVYYLKNDKLVQLNLLNNQEKIFDYSMNDYLIAGGEIYFLSDATLNKTWLKKIDLLKIDEVFNLLPLERSAGLKIVEVVNNMVLIKDEDKLILWDEIENESEIILGAEYYLWNENYDELLFGSEREIWSYRIKEENDQYILFTRLSEAIGKAVWYRPGTHIFYAVKGKIKVEK